MGVALSVALRPSYEVRILPTERADTSPVTIAAPVTMEVSRPVGPLLPMVTVVDVASGVAHDALAGLVKLEPDEHVRAVDDRSIANDLEAGAVIASAADRGYVDLELSTGRRVVLLLH